MDELERELRDLSAWLETGRAAGRDRPGPRPPRPRPPPRGAGGGTGWPPRSPRCWWRRCRRARAALADAVTGLLRFAGVVIDTSATPLLATGTPSPLPGQRPVALVEAQRQVRFPIRVPARPRRPRAGAGRRSGRRRRHRVASLLWRGGALRLDAFDGSLDIAFHKEAAGADVKFTSRRRLRDLGRRPARARVRRSGGTVRWRPRDCPPRR